MTMLLLLALAFALLCKLYPAFMLTVVAAFVGFSLFVACLMLLRSLVRVLYDR